MKQVLRGWLSVLLLPLLVACGGGGDSAVDSPAPVAVPTFPVQSAFQAFARAGQTTRFGMTGSCSGLATLVDAPAVAATFEGVSGYAVVQTLTVVSVNCPLSTGAFSQTLYYDSAFNPLGAVWPGEEYVVAQTPRVPLPASVKVGDTGPLGTLTVYSDATRAVVVAVRQLSYVIEADADASTAVVNLVTREVDATGQVSTEQSRYRLTAAGALSWLSIETQDGAFSLRLTPI